jgi:hypothetical protein
MFDLINLNLMLEGSDLCPPKEGRKTRKENN